MYAVRNKILLHLKMPTLKNKDIFLEASQVIWSFIIHKMRCQKSSNIPFLLLVSVLLPIQTSAWVKSTWSSMCHRLHFLDKQVNYKTLFHHAFETEENWDKTVISKGNLRGWQDCRFPRPLQWMCYIDTMDVIHI